MPDPFILNYKTAKSLKLSNIELTGFEKVNGIYENSCKINSTILHYFKYRRNLNLLTYNSKGKCWN